MEGCPTHHTGSSQSCKDSISPNLGSFEACVPDPSWSSAQPGLAPRGPEVSQLLLSSPRLSPFSAPLGLPCSRSSACHHSGGDKPGWLDLGERQRRLSCLLRPGKVVDEAQCGALLQGEGSRRNSLRLLHPPSSRQSGDP